MTIADLTNFWSCNHPWAIWGSGFGFGLAIAYFANAIRTLRNERPQEPGRHQMTVADLITKLSMFPPDMLVLVDGYESGYDNPCEPISRRVYKDPKYRRFGGNYVEAKGCSAESIDAVVISR